VVGVRSGVWRESGRKTFRSHDLAEPVLGAASLRSCDFGARPHGARAIGVQIQEFGAQRKVSASFEHGFAASRSGIRMAAVRGAIHLLMPRGLHNVPYVAAEAGAKSHSEQFCSCT
jgi:hypothetical protein